MDKLKTAFMATLPVALWVGFSAFATVVLTALLKRPDLAQYYGLLNLLLVFLNEFKNAK